MSSKPRLQFTVPVSSHGTLRKVKVYIYNELEDMYHAAEAYDKKHTIESYDREYHALTHSFEWYDINKDGSEVTHQLTNIIRLCFGYLASYIIVHEIAHAALHIYQLDCTDETDPLFDHINPGNETFCHIVSELEHNIVSKLNRLGAYD